MADDNKNQQWLTPKPPANLPSVPPSVPPAGPKPPAPPPPEITLRTMKSDLESLKQSGGSFSEPKPFTPLELKKEATPPPSRTMPPPPLKITPSDLGEPQKMASPANGTMPNAPIIEEEKPKGGLKKVLTLIAALIIVIGAGLIGYYFIFPALFPPQILPPPPAVTPPPETEIPTATIPEAETIQPKPHQSLLLSPDLTSPATLATVDLSSLQAALRQEAQKSLPNGSLSEIILNSADNAQIPSSVVFSALLPELTLESIKNIFEDDFTAALYFDADGAWPAYILKLNSEATPLEAQAEINNLEFSPNLKNLFASDPGTPATGFKDGQAGGLTSRYLTYSKTGAALNIAWSNDKLIISTSYNGLKKILTNL